MQLANTKATVFDIQMSDKKKNTMIATISTLESAKDEEKKYCSWHAEFVEKAFEKAQGLNAEKDYIEITNGKISNYYSKEKERLYVTVTVFDFYVV
jgi:hypothetical protein